MDSGNNPKPFLGPPAGYYTEQEAADALARKSNRNTVDYVYYIRSTNQLLYETAHTDPVEATSNTTFWDGPLVTQSDVEEALGDQLVPAPRGRKCWSISRHGGWQ